ncbi:MAG: hypothetical protein B6I24_03260 [Bacteroidetes bacterium 4572_128]|nr:MAG: hypothetical protein B6I24_03260 [Bacteroidetes bacterium 4572_128]
MIKEQEIKKHLSEDIKKIMNLPINKKNYFAFQEVIKDLRPKNCMVKFGWESGTAINFTLVYKKNGSGDPYDEFIKGINDKAHAYYFIMGLNPNIFHFNQITVAHIEDYLILKFNLKRNE